jgi:hypothetical protein
MTQTLADLVTEAARVIEPFASLSDSSAKVWDGKQYVAGLKQHFDPAAAKWCGVLSTLGEMLRLQPTAPSQGQRAYVERLLFGGMGSLVDFRLDESAASTEALRANERLGELTHAMFEALQKMR